MTTESETIPAVKVHVESASPGVLDGQTGKRRVLSRYETYVLTASDPAQCILPQDEDRIEYTIIALDNDIILGPTKGVVGAGVNTVASVPNPNGGYIPKSLRFVFKDTNQVYAGVTTTATNSRVTVIDSYYEVPGK
jgi:hypothetical protein